MSLFGSQGRFEGPIALNAPTLAVHNGAAGVIGQIRDKGVMRVLGIETSCDETGVAVYDTERGLLADVLYSQVAIHAEYGGVVPELASRDHVRKTLPLIDQALSEAAITRAEIEGVAYTAGPGLALSLIHI